MAFVDPAVSPVDYEKLFQEIKAKSCRVDRIDRAYEAQGRKPLRTRSHIIDRELEVGSDLLMKVPHPGMESSYLVIYAACL